MPWFWAGYLEMICVGSQGPKSGPSWKPTSWDAGFELFVSLIATTEVCMSCSLSWTFFTSCSSVSESLNPNTGEISNRHSSPLPGFLCLVPTRRDLVSLSRRQSGRKMGVCLFLPHLFHCLCLMRPQSVIVKTKTWTASRMGVDK